MDARIVKTCSLGLKEIHLGKSITELQPKFREFFNSFGFNVCGEGGEYETAVLDCPLFKKRIVFAEAQNTRISADDTAPVCTLLYRGLALQEKSADDLARHAQIIQTRKDAVFSAFEEVKHEEYDYVVKNPRLISLDSAITESVEPYDSHPSGTSLFYTGLVRSSLPAPPQPSLESDKLDLANILE